MYYMGDYWETESLNRWYIYQEPYIILLEANDVSFVVQRKLLMAVEDCAVGKLWPLNSMGLET